MTESIAGQTPEVQQSHLPEVYASTLTYINAIKNYQSNEESKKLSEELNPNNLEVLNQQLETGFATIQGRLYTINSLDSRMRNGQNIDDEIEELSQSKDWWDEGVVEWVKKRQEDKNFDPVGIELLTSATEKSNVEHAEKGHSDKQVAIFTAAQNLVLKYMNSKFSELTIPTSSVQE